MKTLIPAAIRCSLMFTAVYALSIVYSTSVQADPTTYVYIGNPFTSVTGAYTTSDFVTVMMTLASPLPPNAEIDGVTPLAFSMSDGVQTITNLNASNTIFEFLTGPTGLPRQWFVEADSGPFAGIDTINEGVEEDIEDLGFLLDDYGLNEHARGRWTTSAHVPDAGSTYH